jgi:hypothetical protein
MRDADALAKGEHRTTKGLSIGSRAAVEAFLSSRNFPNALTAKLSSADVGTACNGPRGRTFRPGSHVSHFLGRARSGIVFAVGKTQVY